MPNSSSNNPVAPMVPIRLSDFIAFAVTRLRNAHIDNPALDARLLVAHGLKLDRAQLLSQKDRILCEKEMHLLNVFIECRVRHESVARILMEREFWSLPFGLNEATLEPRPDSETLVEVALKSITKRDAALRILDIGTGTGCLLLSLLHELPNATGLGVDIAARAIEQAQENAEKLNLKNRAIFQIKNWLNDVTESFDIIISNPPYIARKEIPTLAPEVKNFDPKLALDGGEDGLDAYRHLIPLLHARLKPKGIAVFEIGYNQSASVTALFKAAGFSSVTLHRDFGGNDRCLLAQVD